MKSSKQRNPQGKIQGIDESATLSVHHRQGESLTKFAKCTENIMPQDGVSWVGCMKEAPLYIAVALSSPPGHGLGRPQARPLRACARRARPGAGRVLRAP